MVEIMRVPVEHHFPQLEQAAHSRTHLTGNLLELGIVLKFLNFSGFRLVWDRADYVVVNVGIGRLLRAILGIARMFAPVTTFSVSCVSFALKKSCNVRSTVH
jgi:hypothetical protein